MASERLLGHQHGNSGIGFDLFPYTEDQVEAVKRSIYQWEYIDSIAAKIDDKVLMQAQEAS